MNAEALKAFKAFEKTFHAAVERDTTRFGADFPDLSKVLVREVVLKEMLVAMGWDPEPGGGTAKRTRKVAVAIRRRLKALSLEAAK